MRNRNKKGEAVKRRVAFRKALLDEGMTVARFAERIGIHRVHLTRSFSKPELASQRVHDAVNAFIQKHSVAGPIA